MSQDNPRMIPATVYHATTEVMDHSEQREFDIFTATLIVGLASVDHLMNKGARDIIDKDVRVIICVAEADGRSDPIVCSNIPLDMEGDFAVLHDSLEAVTQIIRNQANRNEE